MTLRSSSEPYVEIIVENNYTDDTYSLYKFVNLDDNGDNIWELLDSGISDSYYEMVDYDVENGVEYYYCLGNEETGDKYDYLSIEVPYRESSDDGNNGYEDEYLNPDQYITRADFSQMLLNLLEIKYPHMIPDGLELNNNNATYFNDVFKDDWYYRGVNVVYQLGIVGGTGNDNFSPMGYIRRQDMALILLNVYKNISRYHIEDILNPMDLFYDDYQIDYYARSAVYLMYYLRVASISNDEKFRPLDHVTYAEALQMLDNLMEQIGE